MILCVGKTAHFLRRITRGGTMQKQEGKVTGYGEIMQIQIVKLENYSIGCIFRPFVDFHIFALNNSFSGIGY